MDPTIIVLEHEYCKAHLAPPVAGDKIIAKNLLVVVCIHVTFDPAHIANAEIRDTSPDYDLASTPPVSSA